MGRTGHRLGAIVLAAGAGRRFGGGKVLAHLDGRPMLQHVLDAVAATECAATVVVLGADAEVAERLVAWGGALRVRNPAPERGIASSLQMGLAAVAAVEPPLDGVFVVLGDQPLVRPATLRVLAAAVPDALAAGRTIVVPRYRQEDAGVSNPALLLRAAWPLALALEGDRGMGPVIAAHPELVCPVDVEGSNPDVDTVEDLRRL